MMNPNTRPVHEAFAHCPSCGLPRQGAGNPLICECGFRYFFNPAGAVATLISDAEGRLVFIRRERDPGNGKLALPGGFIDAGETGEEAAQREVREELGLEITGLSYLTSHPNTYAYGGVVYQVIDFFYTARVPHFGAVDSDTSEVREWFIARPDAVCSEDFAFRSNAFAVETYASQVVSSV